jgi:hypothetical protein
VVVLGIVMASYRGGVLVLGLVLGCSSESTGGRAPTEGGEAGLEGLGGVAGSLGGRSATGGAGAGGSDGGASSSCVEMVVTPDSLTGESTGISTFRGGGWQTESGVHLAWQAYVSIEGADQYHVRQKLYIGTFAPADGSLVKLQKYDPLPEDVISVGGSSRGNLTAVSGTNTELFAVATASGTEDLEPRNQSLFIGKLDDDSVWIEVDIGFPMGVYDTTDMGWDGEAFVVNSRANSTGEIFVTRVSPQGEVLLPLTTYGINTQSGGNLAWIPRIYQRNKRDDVPVGLRLGEWSRPRWGPILVGIPISPAGGGSGGG